VKKWMIGKEWETSQENVGFKDDIGIAMGLEWDDKQQSSWDRTNSNGITIIMVGVKSIVVK
jgi:hypothetical protein